MKATRAQLAMIHIAKKDLALDDEAYRAVLDAQTGKRSAAKIDYAEASRVIDWFESRGWRRRQAKAEAKAEATKEAKAKGKAEGEAQGAERRAQSEHTRPRAEAKAGPPHPGPLPPGEREKKGRKRFEELGERPGMASPQQLRMIEVMWREVAFGEPHRALRRFTFNRWGVSDPRFLTSRQAWEVTEAVKAMVKRRTK